MTRSFANQGTEDLWEGIDSKAARQLCQRRLWSKARRKLDGINQVRHYAELRWLPGNDLHKLKGDREGQFAIAINKQYRICFRWEGVDALDVEITDYH